MRSRALSYHPLSLHQSLLHTLLGSSVLLREVVVCFLSLPNFFGLWGQVTKVLFLILACICLLSTTTDMLQIQPTCSQAPPSIVSLSSPMVP